MAESRSTKLFRPVTIGNCQLSHRIVMAPMTRFKADDSNVQLDYVPEYYAQRACVPGTMIITEATYISQRSIGAASTPGIWSEQQIDAWKNVTDAVHTKGSFIYCQLWALGRAADPTILKEKNERFLSCSAVAMDNEAPIPTEMTEEDIRLIIGDFAQAARCAIRAGFDGVEIHGANGYLIDQFTQDNCNKRNDKWGGNIENRARFALEVASAVCAAIGSSKTGIRLSPFSPFQGMQMEDPLPQFTHLISSLKALKLAYLHLIEPRVSGISDVEGKGCSDSLLSAWGNTSPIILAGGFQPSNIKDWIQENHTDKTICIAFGRYFISNPDLVFRIREDITVTSYDRSTFYNPRSTNGYIDYPYCEDFKEVEKSGRSHLILERI